MTGRHSEVVEIGLEKMPFAKQLTLKVMPSGVVLWSVE